MAISLVSSGSLAVTSQPTSVNITGIQAGDLIIAAGARDFGPYSTPSSLTLGEAAPSSLPASGWGYAFSTGSSFNLDGLPGNVSSGDNFAWIWMVFRGVDQTNPFNVLDSFFNTASNNTQVDPPSVTTTVDGCLILALGALDDDVSTVSSTPSGYTFIVEQSSNNVADLSATVAASYKVQTTAGTEDPGTYTFSSADLWTAFTIALNPNEKISIGNITLNEVRLYLELGATASLQDCFTKAETFGRDFDPIYEGSKDRLSNFKGYGTPTPPPTPTIESYVLATTSGSASTAITFSSAPSGLTAGDLILILIANERNNDWQYQNVTGYTRVTLASNANDIQLGVYYRIATGDSNDGFPNLSVTYATSNEFAVGWALRISGVDTSDPIPIFGTYQTGIGSTSQTVPGITTTTDDSLVIMFVGLDGSDVDPITITSGTGWTSGDSAEDDAGDQTVGVYGEWYTKEMPTAGATGTVSMSHGNDGWAGLQFAIKPA